MVFPRCGECGGRVVLMARAGRTREVARGVSKAIPDGYQLPTCTVCFEEISYPEIMGPLDELLGGAK